uniref:Uncharacterized protein n=1 Tax=Sphaerodactylus townsendi TaxID=933632 RepID=A0ACB8EWJ0_9SAUR
MAIILFLFALATIPRRAFSDVQLVSSGPGTLRPGENLHLVCTVTDVQLVSSGPGTLRLGQNLHLVCKVTGFSITTQGYGWNWIRQAPGKRLEWVAYLYPNDGSKYYASSLRGRVAVSADSSKNQFSLQLNSLTAADSAVYFCARDSQ